MTDAPHAESCECDVCLTPEALAWLRELVGVRHEPAGFSYPKCRAKAGR